MELTGALNIEQLEVLLAQWENVTGVKLLLTDKDENVVAGSGTPSDCKKEVMAGSEVLAYVCEAKTVHTEDTGTAEKMAAHCKEVEAMAVVINKIVEIEMGRMAEKELSIAVHETVQKTGAYIQKINDITKQLDKIEKNQKILALNASIEAARAGEAGKGFAIVATNVSALATDFGNNNREIKAELQNLNNVMAEIEKTGQNM